MAELVSLSGYTNMLQPYVMVHTVSFISDIEK